VFIKIWIEHVLGWFCLLGRWKISWGYITSDWRL